MLDSLRAPLSAMLIACLTVAAQSQTQAPATIDKNAPEMTTKEAPAVFNTHVDLVSVPVVVRDPKGRVVSTLTKENFQVYDRGKLQEIVRFSMEKAGGLAAKAVKSVDAVPAGGVPSAAPDIPERFVGYLFDDLHASMPELAQTCAAVSKQLSGMAKSDRAAIFTTSGQNQIDFTDDISKLQAALLLLRNRSISSAGGVEKCPEISYYMADMIVNKNDSTATSYAAQETWACRDFPDSPQGYAAAATEMQAIARQVVATGEHETQIALAVLNDVVRRMALAPGQRILVLISPGFLTTDEYLQHKSTIQERAIKAHVVINSLDSRGLWVDPSLDASRPSGAANQGFLMLKQDYDRKSAQVQSDVLGEMAFGTGGSLYANKNSLDEGIRQLSNTPEAYYLLGFAPQNLKFDGSFHSLKVTVRTAPSIGVEIQARKGYYAPAKGANAEATAKAEIEEAVFSDEDLHDLPVELHTQFFKISDKEATLTVVCRMDPRQLQFKKADGRNLNFLTIDTALFDHNGNFVSGMEKTVDIKMKDETMVKLMAAGTMAFKTNFSVAPGSYLIRLVVRDAEAQLMSGLTGAVAIQ